MDKAQKALLWVWTFRTTRALCDLARRAMSAFIGRAQMFFEPTTSSSLLVCSPLRRFHAHAGNSTLGASSSNSLTINAKLQGATPLVFEGATINGHHTNLAVTDPSGTRTITLPDASGQVVLQDSHGNVVVPGLSLLLYFFSLVSVPGNITAGSQQLNLLDEVLQLRQFLQSTRFHLCHRLPRDQT